jgi:hypothetical protein
MLYDIIKNTVSWDFQYLMLIVYYYENSDGDDGLDFLS